MAVGLKSVYSAQELRVVVSFFLGTSLSVLGENEELLYFVDPMELPALWE